MSLSPCEFISGSLGGVAGRLITHPFDTIKVRMQLYDDKSLRRVAKEILRNEGVRGYFKGYLFPTLSSGFINSIYFGVFGNTLRNMLDGDSQTLCCERGYGRPHVEFHWKTAISGFLGGVAGTLLACPAECIKTKQQGEKIESLSAFSVAKQLYQQRGIRGMYCGGVPMLWRNGIGLSIYVLSYEHALCAMEGELDQNRESTRILSEIVSGGLAGACFWIVAIPLDVIKSRIQFDDPVNPKYKGVIDCFRQSYRADGLSIFTKGLSIALIASVPSNATTWVVYQLSMRHCKTSCSSWK